MYQYFQTVPADAHSQRRTSPPPTTDTVTMDTGTYDAFLFIDLCMIKIFNVLMYP